MKFGGKREIFTVYSRPFLPFSLYVVELQVVQLPSRHKHTFVSSRRVSGSIGQSTIPHKRGDRDTWKEQSRDSSTDIIAPALSNSPQ